MQLSLRDGLALVTVPVVYRGREVQVPAVAVDTGSATTLLSADAVVVLGIVPAPDDVLYTIRGIGGVEVVFARRVDRLQIGEQAIPGFEVEIGGMDYGFDINGILGMGFLLQAGVVIDLDALRLDFPRLHRADHR